jgi:hypothetical protein
MIVVERNALCADRGRAHIEGSPLGVIGPLGG